MGHAVLSTITVAFSRRPVLLGIFPIALAFAWRQVGPPGPPPPGPAPPGPPVEVRLADLRKKLDTTKAVDMTAQRALQYSLSYWKKAEGELRTGQKFSADRHAEAADALLHIAEHQQHLRTGGGPKGPPPPEELQEHLRRVYFRTQQSGYFLRQAHAPEAASFPKWAQDFYQLALRAYDRKDWLAADENAKCAEEVVRALEGLAQAAIPANAVPPPRPAVR